MGQAKDAGKLRECAVFLHNLWAAPLTAIGCTVLLLRLLGPSALVGVAAIPILIPVETWDANGEPDSVDKTAAAVRVGKG